MKEYNKEEYNKMCAEFLGFEISENEECFKLPNKNGWVKLSIFHSDWNWIMEVVEKIQETHVVCSIGKSNKEAVVQSIWNFLNWYKTQTV